VNDSDLAKALGEWGQGQTPGAGPVPVRVATGGSAESGGVDADSAPEGEGPGNYTTVAPQMLVTYKQYAPHGQPTLFTNPDASTTADGGSLLSAQDKIGELTRLVEQQKADLERMAKEMEDVQAEKVSMEYLLREKLERLVQNEIEERLTAYRKEGQDQQGLLLQQRLRTLKAELEKKTNEVTAFASREQKLQVSDQASSVRAGGRAGSSARVVRLVADGAVPGPPSSAFTGAAAAGAAGGRNGLIGTTASARAGR
jgi:hypothetical protein